MHQSIVLAALARAFLSAAPDVDQLVARGNLALGREWSWMRSLTKRYLSAFAEGTRPDLRTVIRFLQEDGGLQAAFARYGRKISIQNWLTETPEMQPVASAREWRIPGIKTAGELADWLSVDIGRLLWFADRKRLAYRQTNPRLRHYTYRVLPKSTGGYRVLEAPKRSLKELQRRILSGILQRIPLSSSVHGFCRGCSIKSFAAPHVGKEIVLRMDLEDYFPSISSARVEAFFRTAGYPGSVSALLAGICTTATPLDIWRSIVPANEPALFHERKSLYARPHLPQGAPTSPALANLCSYRMDRRLEGLAASLDLSYTRYADDLAFSGSGASASSVQWLPAYVAVIAMEEGFSVQHRKTRIMHQGVRQYLAGTVVNRRVNVVRSDFDRLKAILTNCVRSGPETQNRDEHPCFRSHLEGRVGFVEMINPEKGMRLRRILEQIRWEEVDPANGISS